jgi:hypothetical protein
MCFPQFNPASSPPTKPTTMQQLMINNLLSDNILVRITPTPSITYLLHTCTLHSLLAKAVFCSTDLTYCLHSLVAPHIQHYHLSYIWNQPQLGSLELLLLSRSRSRLVELRIDQDQTFPINVPEGLVLELLVFSFPLTSDKNIKHQVH